MNEGGLFAFQSPDGIHWSLMRGEPVITKALSILRTSLFGTPRSVSIAVTFVSLPEVSRHKRNGSQPVYEPSARELQATFSTGERKPT